MTDKTPLEVNAEGMHIVADFIDALNESRGNGPHVSWRAEDVRFLAQKWEAEEAAKRAEENRIEELAQAMRQVMIDSSGTGWMFATEEIRNNYRRSARKLVKKGWTKS